MSPVPLSQWTRFDGAKTTITMYDEVRRTPKMAIEANDYYRPSNMDWLVRDLKDGSWEMISMNIPGQDPFDKGLKRWYRQINEIWRWIRDFEPTLAWVNDDDTFVAIKLMSEGIPQKWADLRKLAIHMGGNVMKRFGALVASSYMNKVFEKSTLVEEPMYGPHPMYDFNPHDVVVMAVDDPEEVHTVDGEFYMRRDMFKYLLAKMDRLIRAYDPKKADAQYKKHTETDVFTMRGLEEMLLKGHVIICDELEAPIVIHRSNIKKELENLEGSLPVHLVPEKSGKRVRSNRSTVGIFFDSLFAVDTPGRANSEGLLFDAFRDEIDEIRHLFRTGQPLPFVKSVSRHQPDAIHNQYTMIEDWVDAGFNLNTSLYLQAMQSGMIRKTYDDIPEGKEPKKRTSMRAPYAKAHKIKCWSTYRRANPRSTREEPAYGEYFTDPRMGMVVSNDCYRDIIKILGGGDLDDGIEEHRRILLEKLIFLGMEFDAGEEIAVIIRNPVGITCDVHGVIGVEYVILRPCEDELLLKVRPEHEEGLPELDPSLLPVNITDLGPLSLSFPAPAPVNAPNYTFKFFKDAVHKAAETIGIYGSHVNVRLNHLIYGHPFEAVGLEENFIDTTSKTRDGAGLSLIKATNAIERASMDSMFEALEPEEVDELLKNNPINKVMAFHEKLTAELMRDVRDHLVLIQEMLAIAHEDMDTGVTPEAIGWVKKTEDWHKKRMNIRKLRGNSDYEYVGDKVAKQLMEYIADPKKTDFTKESVQADLREAFFWSFTQVKEYSTDNVESMYYNHDGILMRGQLFQMLVAALEAGE